MVVSKALYYSSTAIKISELRPLEPELIVLQEEQTQEYDRIAQWCQDHHVFSTTADERDYHFKFRQIVSAPYVVYALGDIHLLDRHILAVVGPRNISPYGKQVVEKLFDHAKNYDLVTISGLADGVDMLCHEQSITTGIPTIAVLGGGLVRYLKSGKREMIKKIIDNGGLILSEFKINSRPEKYTFPQRNRIVAGLSDMVFVPEAAMKSGSLITVDFARQMHKDVYGIPNSIFAPNSQGLLHAMQQGRVIPVVELDDMFGKYFGKRMSNEQGVMSHEGVLFDDYGEESEVLSLLEKNPPGLSLNDLVNQTGLSTEDVMSQLSMGEVMGQAMNDGGVWRRK